MAKPTNHVTVAAKRSGGKRKLRHVHIEPAKNGVTVSASYEPEGKGDMMSMMDNKPEASVFTKHKEAMKHVGSLLAPHFGGGESAAHEAAESPAKEKAEEDAADEED